MRESQLTVESRCSRVGALYILLARCEVTEQDNRCVRTIIAMHCACYFSPSVLVSHVLFPSFYSGLAVLISYTWHTLARACRPSADCTSPQGSPTILARHLIALRGRRSGQATLECPKSMPPLHVDCVHHHSACSCSSPHFNVLRSPFRLPCLSQAVAVHLKISS